MKVNWEYTYHFTSLLIFSWQEVRILQAFSNINPPCNFDAILSTKKTLQYQFITNLKNSNDNVSELSIKLVITFSIDIFGKKIWFIIHWNLFLLKVSTWSNQSIIHANKSAKNDTTIIIISKGHILKTWYWWGKKHSLERIFMNNKTNSIDVRTG